MQQYHTLLSALHQRLGPAKQMVPATSFDGRTTARMMSCVILDGMFYFQTDRTFLKYEQMTANPSVALCTENIQIEGRAIELGHPLKPANALFAQAYQRAYPGSFSAYSALPTEVLFKVEPTMLTLYEYENNKPVRKIFICKQESYCEENSPGGS